MERSYHEPQTLLFPRSHVNPLNVNPGKKKTEQTGRLLLIGHKVV